MTESRGAIGRGEREVAPPRPRSPGTQREPAPGEPLTSREHQVLAHVARGGTNEEVGLALGISERTVQKHLQRVFRKLGVRTRTAAVAQGLEPSRSRPTDAWPS